VPDALVLEAERVIEHAVRAEHQQVLVGHPLSKPALAEPIGFFLQDEAVMVQAYFPKKFTVAGAHVRDFRADPQDYYRMDKVWLA